MKETTLEDLEKDGWIPAGENKCGGCDGTLYLYVSSNITGQAEYCENCGLKITAGHVDDN